MPAASGKRLCLGGIQGRRCSQARRALADNVVVLWGGNEAPLDSPVGRASPPPIQHSRGGFGWVESDRATGLEGTHPGRDAERLPDVGWTTPENVLRRGPSRCVPEGGPAPSGAHHESQSHIHPEALSETETEPSYFRRRFLQCRAPSSRPCRAPARGRFIRHPSAVGRTCRRCSSSRNGRVGGCLLSAVLSQRPGRPRRPLAGIERALRGQRRLTCLLTALPGAEAAPVKRPAAETESTPPSVRALQGFPGTPALLAVRWTGPKRFR